ADHRESTLEALARLDEERELWRPAADALDHWAKVAADPAVRTAALFRAAALFSNKLGDKKAAEERYARVLESDPGHGEAMEELASIYREQGDWGRTARFLLEVADQRQNRAQKVALLFEVATLYQDKLSDDTKAADLYAAALAVDAEHAAAAERLAPLYTRDGRWTLLEP